MGGWDVFMAYLDQSRLTAVDFNEWGYKGKHEYGFWPVALGGLFLYMSYYGCDQTQSQRLVSSKDQTNLNIALLFNGLARFPMVLAYCIMGLIVGAFAYMTPVFMNEIPRADGILKPDFMLPTFIVHYLPAGIVGLLLVAVLSAAMSSISGTLNSLSAATLKDIVLPYFKKDMNDNQAYKWSLWFTVIWGIACTIIALFGDKFAETAIEAINKVGSLFYGSILAVFILGFCTKRTNAFGVKSGLVIGVLFNAYLWLCMPELSWLWWNLTGFLVSVITGYFISIFTNYLNSEGFDTMKAFKWSFMITSLWGIICFSLFVLSDQLVSDFIIVVHEAGSILFGAIIGIYLAVAICKKNIAVDSLLGFILGFFVNIILWFNTSSTPWFLWFLLGLIVSAVFGYIIWFSGKPEEKEVDPELLTNKKRLLQPNILTYAVILIGFFVFMVVFSAHLMKFFQ